MRFVESMKQILKKPYFFFFSILLFFTPLILVTNTNELFEFPKMFFIYIFGLFIICFFISDLILNNKFAKFRKPSLVVSIFFLITLISTIFSSHIYTSFFGYYTRFNDGLLSYIVFFGLYLVAINKLNKEDFLELAKVAILPVLPISIYGLAQYFGGPSIFWSLPAVERVYSTIGQPNWLSQYLGILLVICVYFALNDSFGNFKLWFSLYAIGFFCFWVTYSMSGLVGFAAGVLVLVFNYLVGKKNEEESKEGKEKKDRKVDKVENISFRIALLILVTISILISNLGLYKGKFNDVLIDIKKTVSVVKKVYALSTDYEVSDPGFIRIELWKSTLNLIKSSPKVFFIGIGPETFPYEFQKYRNTRLNYSSEWDYVFNKPHNYYLEIWSESGIFALGIYLYLLFLVIKNSPKFLVPAIVVFIVTNIFGWPTVATALLFWFFVSWSEVWKKD